ncbi:hypothetical protein IFM62136_07814 [Aspergillus lentulus]|nr:hypothetical protein IFM62136_07814 [Aspergillus lentulus]
MSRREDDLAYGQYHRREDGQGESTRSFVGDTFKKLKDTYKQQHSQPQQTGQSQSQGPFPGGYGGQSYQNQGSSQSHPYGSQNQNPYQDPYQNPEQQGKPAKQDKLSGLLGKLQDTVTGLGSEVAQRVGNVLDPQQAYAQYGPNKPQSEHRFGSFAPPRQANDAKWYVDGCSYFYAVSKALESARESIWILDWWLSPELYLRRPPAKNEQYRLDRMLQAAAQRGVRVNVIVYKEVTQALTPHAVSSSHTKHALEDLHPNIAVFRHPDHLPDRQGLASSISSSLQNLTLDTVSIAKMSGDALKGLYGMNDDVILYWAHHEKLCLIDGRIAFMGGLDMCFGRWDTHQHAIADVHPTNLDDIVFPGQDYNNARVLDFQDVVHWEKNQLDRKRTSRMGWSDISVSLHGPVVEDLRRHFVERWNFIYDTKYQVRKDARYTRLVLPGGPGSPSGQQYNAQQSAPHHPTPPQQQAPGLSGYPSQPSVGGQGAPGYQSSPSYAGYSPSQSGGHQSTYTGDSFPPPPPGPPPSQYSPAPQSQFQAQGHGQAPYFPPPPNQEGSHSQTRGFDDSYEEARGQGDSERGSGFIPRRLKDELTGYSNVIRGQLAGQVHQYQDRLTSFGRHNSQPRGNMSCQIVRSCAKWSNGTPTEHSIADAYAAVIRNSEHFVYIENQFFITATGDAQKPVKNKIGAAIVERIVRAARAGQKYKIIVVIPTVPCFAGDLEDDASLGTRAIMEFQYNSINRGGHSIMELIAKEGVNPMEYIRFYNLRNYDRINVNSRMMEAEHQSGVNYEDARRQHDLNAVGQGGYGPGPARSAFDTSVPFQQQYQQAAHQVSTAKPTSSRWDTVSECYMLHGEDIRNVPWEGPSEAEIDAFVTEELYVHSKVMIADDRVVICGSANLNDRSQLGDHDSEIAVIIEDYTPVQSTMNGKPWTASRFAASLRRQLFRKHLGLLPPQDYQRPDANSEPVGIPNDFDFDAPESQIVADPLADTLQSLWNTRARTNTEVFRKVFHAVPDDTVRNWATYREFYSYYFQSADKQSYDKDGKVKPARYEYGHVVRDDFPAGPEGVRQVKELLSQVKGTLVEMPLMFLIEEDVAKSGLTLNDLTEPLYT